MANVYYAPEPLDKIKESCKIFLAGSIEMDKAERWQDRAISLLADVPNLAILNPRRKEWDSTWKQDINNPVFKEQVEWELNGIELADKVLFYFDPETKSPITLLELGLCAGLKEFHQVHVYCPDGFWRKGNVDIVVQRYGFNKISSLEEINASLICV